MLNKQHNSVITLAAILLALVGTHKPAKAFLLTQANPAPTTFSVPDTLPNKAQVQVAASNSVGSINQSLIESFSTKYPQAKVNLETQSSEKALQSLSEGKVDVVGIGRNLTATEKQQGFVAVPISREKIAIVIAKNNPFNGNLTISQFAKIFRGEITDWSEIGGNPGVINLVDLPSTNDTRQAFPSYPVFQEGEFATGDNAVELKEDSTEEMIAQLGANGIGYAVANDAIGRDDVKVVTMHQTQPDDQRYPFSQPFYLVYQGSPSQATKAFLGFATSEAGEKVIANRVGSMPIATAAAIASQLGSKNTTGVLPDTDTNKTGTGTGTDANPTANNAGTDADADTIAQADGEPKDIQDSGQVNSDVEGSGKPNSELEGSGEVNPDLKGSGEVNPDLEGSGEVNPDAQGSGELNPDLEESGKPSATNQVDNNGTVAANSTDTDATNSDTNIPADADATETTTANQSKNWKWWWLPLILGIPLLVAIAMLFGGRRNKSDREPAITNLRGGDNPGDGDISLGTSDDDGLSAVGANTARGLDNVASNTVNTTSTLGGAAIAGGAVATNFMGNRTTSDEDIEEVELDDLDLSTSEVDPPVIEIPSNPVNEFTGQETKLQVGDQSTKLQTDNLDDSFTANTSGLLDDLNISNVGGAAAIGGTAAAGFLSNREDEVVNNPVVEDEGTTFVQTGDTSEQPTKLQTTDTEVDLEAASADSAQVTQEFRGDFVLDEENSSELTTETDQSHLEGSSGWLDGISNVGGAAAIGGAAAAAGFFSRDTTQDDYPSDRTDITDELNTEIGEVNLATPNVDGDISGVSGEFTTNETEIGEVNLATPKVDTDISSTEETRTENASGWLDGISNVGGAAAASGFFSRDTTQDDYPSDRTDITDELNTEIGEVNLATPNVDGDIFGVSGEFTTNETEIGEVNLATPKVDTDISSTEETRTENASGWLDGISNVGGAAAIGGAAAAAGFFSRDTTQDDYPSDRTDITDELNTEIGEVNLATPNVDGDISGVSGEFTTNETEIGEVNLATPKVDTDISSTEETRTENASGWLDGISNVGGAAAIGGAASGFFSRDTTQDDYPSDRTDITDELNTEIGEVNLATPNVDGDISGVSGETATGNLEIGLDEITFDNTADITFDDTETSTDINLEDITFDDVDTDNESINASLADITFDDTETSTDINLEDITFDDVDTDNESINASLADITFDDTETSTDINLEDITFDDVDTDNSVDLTLDEITSENDQGNSIDELIDSIDNTPDSKEISLDDLGFEESTDDYNYDLLSNNTAKITDLTDGDNSDDMNNISNWLDSIETPSQNSEDISSWLEQLNVPENNPEGEDSNNEKVMPSQEETEEISFQFLEDLLERNANSNTEN